MVGETIRLLDLRADPEGTDEMNDPYINMAMFGAILLPILAAEFWFFWWIFRPRNKGD